MQSRRKVQLNQIKEGGKDRICISDFSKDYPIKIATKTLRIISNIKTESPKKKSCPILNLWMRDLHPLHHTMFSLAKNFTFPYEFLHYYKNYDIGIPYEYEEYLKSIGVGQDK